MKIATCIFFLVVLVLGAFAFCGYLIDSNITLKGQVGDEKLCQIRVNQLTLQVTAFDSDLKNALDKIIALQSALDEQTKLTILANGKYTDAQENIKKIRADLDNALVQLNITTAALNESKNELEQTKAKLQQVTADRDRLSLLQKVYQGDLASIIPIDPNVLVVILSGILVVEFSFLGMKRYQVTHRTFNQESQVKDRTTSKGTVTLTMNENVYRDFVAYLKNPNK